MLIYIVVDSLSVSEPKLPSACHAGGGLLWMREFALAGAKGGKRGLTRSMGQVECDCARKATEAWRVWPAPFAGTKVNTGVQEYRSSWYRSGQEWRWRLELYYE